MQHSNMDILSPPKKEVIRYTYEIDVTEYPEGTEFIDYEQPDYIQVSKQYVFNGVKVPEDSLTTGQIKAVAVGVAKNIKDFYYPIQKEIYIQLCSEIIEAYTDKLRMQDIKSKEDGE